MKTQIMTKKKRKLAIVKKKYVQWKIYAALLVLFTRLPSIKKMYLGMNQGIQNAYVF